MHLLMEVKSDSSLNNFLDSLSHRLEMINDGFMSLILHFEAVVLRVTSCYLSVNTLKKRGECVMTD